MRQAQGSVQGSDLITQQHLLKLMSRIALFHSQRLGSSEGKIGKQLQLHTFLLLRIQLDMLLSWLLKLRLMLL